MYGYFSFTAQKQDPGLRALVVFCATSRPSIDDVLSVVRKHGDTNISPEELLLIGIDSERARLQDIVTDDRLREHLASYTRNSSPPPVHAFTIPRKGLDASLPMGSLEWGTVRLCGMRAIFLSRHTLLVAPPTHHFAKPSKRHSSKFIRAANALVDGAEITFIAALCLDFVSDSVTHYYCDTGGIGVLAFALDSLRKRFEPSLPAATVNTFESYGGLKTFEFRDCDRAVVLVSASTSCGLEQEVIAAEGRLRPAQIVTLFSTGKRTTASPAIYDLEYDSVARQEVGEFTSYAESDCPLCRQNSIVVPMTGDQFIPVRSHVHPVLLMRKDAPSWLSRTLELMAGKNILRAFYKSPNTLHATTDVFVDLQRLLSPLDCSDPLTRRISRAFIQSVPAATRRIIHLDDDASALLAASLAADLNTLRSSGAMVQMVSAKTAGESAAPLEQGATVVVAAAIASGQSLLSISQLLRRLQANGAIVYLIALSRMGSQQDAEKLERDLRMGEMASDFGVSVAERIYLPVVGRFAGGAWDEELALLLELANVETGVIRETLEARVEILRNAQGKDGRGLARDLFWPDHAGNALKLRDGFVYLPRSILAADMSQGDVYFTIVSVLHHLRFSLQGSSSLRQTEYERRVLSPLCFDRFNDGVIQAALLRGALRPELDYSSFQEQSQQMMAILRALFSTSHQRRGEASREFLLAMALGRMQLRRADMEALYKEFAESSGKLDAVSGLFWGRVRERWLS